MEAQSITCPFCGNPYQQGQYHPCADKIFSSAMIPSAQIKKDPQTLFQNIDNMVFEGGGIKGLGYLGVMDQFINVMQIPIFKNLKRVAGNSAGSITALYVALNLDYQSIYNLMDVNYQALLDDGIVLRVVNPISKDHSWDYKDFKAVDVFFAARDLLSGVINKLKANPSDPVAKKQLETIITDVLVYYSGSTKITNVLLGDLLYEGSGIIADYLANYIISFLAPGPGIQPPNLLSTLVSESTSKPLLKTEDFSSPNSEKSEFDKTISEVAKSAFHKYKEKKSATNGHVLSEGNQSEKNGKLDNGIDFYISQLHQPFVGPIDPKEQIDGTMLNYAIGEMTWFIFISQTDADGKKQPLGLFTGNVIQKQLLEGAIQKRFKDLGRNDYKPGFTFKELDDFRDSTGRKLFKPFYVTSFNPLNQTTDVFSVENTPNAVACEAVRASMSIPVFFQPVMVHENGQPRQVFSMDSSGKLVGEIVRYMDGGVLDNYPLFMFDALKYCVPADLLSTWTPQKRITVQNPKTLGFRLLSPETIPKYKQPYFDPAKTERKKLGAMHDTNNFGFVGQTLLDGWSNSENEFLKYGNCPRSILVNDLDISATSFDLTPQQKLDLIQQGRDAVKDYILRAASGFIGEGEDYPSTVPTYP